MLVLKKYLIVVLGCVLTAAGLNFFLIPGRIAAGGVSGIATIVENLLGIKAAITVLILNIPILVSAWIFKGKNTFFKAMVGSVLLSIFLEVLSFVPFRVYDLLLCAIGGGVLTGIGMGLVFKSEFSTGGTDILALLLQLKYPYLPIGTLLMFADGAVIVTSGIIFHSVEICIYACIALFLAVKLIDFIVVGADFAKAVMIISPKTEEISKDVISLLDRGVTGLQSRGMYGGKQGTMLLCVIRKNQIVKLKSIVEKHDKNAFLIVSDVTEVIGEGFRK